MTREEHIKQAEELLAGTWEQDVYLGRPDRHRPPTPSEIARAQVHATLALSAPLAEPEKPAPTEEDRERFRSRTARSWRDDDH